MRRMRRSDRETDPDTAINLLSKCEFGVLSTVDEGKQPYGIPVNYVHHNNSIFFHCAKAGYKLDNIKYNPKVSFCVVGRTKILPSEFSTEY